MNARHEDAINALTELFIQGTVPADLYQISADVQLIMHETKDHLSLLVQEKFSGSICDLRVKKDKTQTIYRLSWDGLFFCVNICSTENLNNLTKQISEPTILDCLITLLG